MVLFIFLVDEVPAAAAAVAAAKASRKQKVTHCGRCAHENVLVCACMLLSDIIQAL